MRQPLQSRDGVFDQQQAIAEGRKRGVCVRVVVARDGGYRADFKRLRNELVRVRETPVETGALVVRLRESEKKLALLDRTRVNREIFYFFVKELGAGRINCRAHQTGCLSNLQSLSPTFRPQDSQVLLILPAAARGGQPGLTLASGLRPACHGRIRPQTRRLDEVDDAFVIKNALRKLDGRARLCVRLCVRLIARRPVRRPDAPQTLPTGNHSASHSVFRVLVSALLWGHNFKDERGRRVND
jgi:hypothetical protein